MWALPELAGIRVDKKAPAAALCLVLERAAKGVVAVASQALGVASVGLVHTEAPFRVATSVVVVAAATDEDLRAEAVSAVERKVVGSELVAGAAHVVATTVSALWAGGAVVLAAQEAAMAAEEESAETAEGVAQAPQEARPQRCKTRRFAAPPPPPQQQ